MRGRPVLAILGLFALVMVIALLTYLGGRDGQNASRGSGLGVDLTARIVGNTSDPASPILVELVCTNTQDVGNITVSPFPEWGFNPIFVLQTPGGEVFRSYNSRFGLPPDWGVVLLPGRNASRVYDLYNVPRNWLWTSKDRWHNGPGVLTQPGEYELTVVYYPFYHEWMTNSTRANTTLKVSLVFEMTSSFAIAHLGTSDLLFLGEEIGSILFHAGPGPYWPLGTLLDPYDLVILDNVPPEWVGNDSKVIRQAVLEEGLDLVIFGGPNSLAGNATYSSWCDTVMGDLLPVNCAGLYQEIPLGYRVRKIGSGREGVFEHLDTSNLDTLRHMNPCDPKPGASVWLVLEWEARRSDFFLVEWEAGKGKIMVCPASLGEILEWEKGKDLVSRIVQAARMA